jgi:hypothetical protein
MNRSFLLQSGCGRVGLAVPLVLLLLSAVSAESLLPRARTKGGQAPQPMVAVDNVCAWPNLTVLRDGTVVATIFNQPSHGSVAGDVECWASTDGGRTWQKRGTPAPHEPNTNRMNVAAGLAQNGDLIVISSGWSNRYPPGRKGAPFRAGILDPWVCRSADGGRTWKIDPHGFPAKGPRGGQCIPFGDILPGNDGQLRVAIYEVIQLRDDRAVVYRSPDDGKTWAEPAMIDPSQYRNETAIFHLGSGHWLAAARVSELQLYRSDDDAKTWKPLGPVTQPSQHPGHLLRLRDGRLVLTYGNRTADRGVDVRYSRDEGKTWSGPVRLVDFQNDGGYPSSVQLPDGQVLTAYYAAKTAYHDRYHMGAVVWDPSAAPQPDIKAEFLSLCDAGAKILHKQARAEKREGRAFYWDSYLARALCVAYDMTGDRSYLDACKRWSDRMIEYQEKMIPQGAYYMQYGRSPGESKGDWYVADCSSIALGVLATSVRCDDPAPKRRYLDSVKAFAKLVAENWVRPSGGVTDGYWPASDKEWWCSTGIYGSLAFCLYDETHDPAYLKIGLGTIGWLNREDLLTVCDVFPPKEIRPTVLMYCLEAYSAGLPHLQAGTELHKSALAQCAKMCDWMAKNFGGRAGINYVSQWGSKFGGLPFHLYVYARHVPQSADAVRLADEELRYLAAQLASAKPSHQRDQLALFAMLSYAESLSPGSIYRVSKR